MALKLMSKQKRAKRTKRQNIQKFLEEQQPEKSKTLIILGILMAMSSMGLLIYVLSEKIFHLS